MKNTVTRTRSMQITAMALSVCLLAGSTVRGAETSAPSPMSYKYNAMETMYLAGVREAAYQEGCSYTLYDPEGDEIPELFVLRKNADSKTLEVYGYDEGSGAPLLEQTLKGDECDAFIENLPDQGEGLMWADDTQWADSSIFGVALETGNTGAETDYYLYSGFDWLSAQQIEKAGDTVNSIGDQKQLVKEKKEQMFMDEDNFRGEDIRRVRDYYDLASDWEKRNRDGADPVIKYLDAAKNISSLEEMTDFLTDPEADPFCTFISTTVTLNEEDTSEWAVAIGEDTFSVLPRIYHNEDRESIESVRTDCDVQARYVLKEAGYETDEIDRIMSECFEVEERLLPYAWPAENEEEDELYGFLPYDTVTGVCTNFPLKQILSAYAVTGGNIKLYYPEYLRQLDLLYVEENLSLLKSYIIAHTAWEACGYLDLKAAVFAENIGTGSGEGSGKEAMENLNDRYREEALSERGLLGVAEENAYMTFYADPEIRSDLTALVIEIKDTFREMLLNEEWMSEAGKAAAVEKLDAMTFSVLMPDTLIDSSYLTVDTEGTYLDAYARLYTANKIHNGSFAGKKHEAGEWRYDLRPDCASSVDNAFYYGAFNQFFILAGFITDDVYTVDMSREEKLARMGEIIGHELTHGFDPNGIAYDKNGNKVASEDNPCGWMPAEDYEAFQIRAQKIADYFDRIVPFPGYRCPGSIVWGEAAADLGGMSICLKIAEKEESFDYDLFFRAHSLLWLKQTTLIGEQSAIYDEHPLSHLRINTTVQQFDEFCETYSVEEGDLMYLAPEDRILIW